MTYIGMPGRFLLVGVVNTLVTLTLIFLAKGLFGIGDAVANLIGYAFGLLMSFALNRQWTFKHNGAVARSLPAFLGVQAVAYVLNLSCVLVLIDLGMNGYLAQISGIPPYTLVSYFGSRYVVFDAREYEK